MITCKQTNPQRKGNNHRVDIKHDLSIPINITPPLSKDASVQEADEHYNAYLLQERQMHGKRTVLKLAWEVYARKSAKHNGMNRLRNRAVLIDLPSSEQAELVMATVRRVVESMHGKLLVKSE